jgi:putative endonuclease
MSLGRAGEARAARFLEAQGYVLLARNWRVREGELDIVAQEGDTLAFVEVKTRRSNAYGLGEESIDARKQQRLALLAERFLAAHPDLAFQQCRFDVVVIDYTQRPAQIRLYRNAFDLNRLGDAGLI